MHDKPPPLTTAFIENILTNKKCRAVGEMGEELAARLLQKSGYRVRRNKPGTKRGDLTATDPATGEVVNLEVKTARRASDGKWRFTLWKKGHTDHRNSDRVLLLAVTRSGRAIPFIIPTSEVANQHQAVICSHPDTYNGKLAQYRQSPAYLQL